MTDPGQKKRIVEARIDELRRIDDSLLDEAIAASNGLELIKFRHIVVARISQLRAEIEEI